MCHLIVKPSRKRAIQLTLNRGDYMTTRQATMILRAADGIQQAMKLFDGVNDGTRAAELMKAHFPWSDDDRSMTVERSAYLGYIFRVWQDNGCPELSNDTT
jgi:hypothetical protein